MNRKRPSLLSALCFLSFIGSGLAFIGYFLASLFFEETCDIITTYSSWYSTEQLSPLYFTFLMALYGRSVVSVIRIWKFHRDGYFLYMAVHTIILFFPAIWIGWSVFSATNSIFTVVFMGGFSLFYRHLK